MINLEADRVILLAPIGDIGKALAKELQRRVSEIEKQSSYSRSIRSDNSKITRFFAIEGYQKFSKVDEFFFKN